VNPMPKGGHAFMSADAEEATKCWIRENAWQTLATVGTRGEGQESSRGKTKLPSGRRAHEPKASP
jgi:hypothetical protein